LAREHGLVFGMTYDSPMIVPDGTAPVQVANLITDYAPNARSGKRAPHVWLESNRERISTIDLFGRGFVLLAGAQGERWCEAAGDASRSFGIPIQTFCIGCDTDLHDSKGVWMQMYEVEEEGALLVHPDGYVTWRSRSGNRDEQREMNSVISIATRKPIPQGFLLTLSLTLAGCEACNASANARTGSLHTLPSPQSYVPTLEYDDTCVLTN
jgi:putative polyketide hydroxylase